MPIVPQGDMHPVIAQPVQAAQHVPLFMPEMHHQSEHHPGVVEWQPPMVVEPLPHAQELFSPGVESQSTWHGHLQDSHMTVQPGVLSIQTHAGCGSNVLAMQVEEPMPSLPLAEPMQPVITADVPYLYPQPVVEVQPSMPMFVQCGQRFSSEGLGQPEQPIDLHAPAITGSQDGPPHFGDSAPAENEATSCETLPSLPVARLGPESVGSEPQQPHHDWPRGMQDMPGMYAMVPANSSPSQVAMVMGPKPKPEPKLSRQPSALVLPAKPGELPGQVAVVRLDAGATLTADVARDSKTAQWEWARAVDFVKLKTNKHYMYLSRNMDYFNEELQAAEVPTSALMYRGKDAGGKMSGHHLMQSPAFMLMILLICCNKRFSTEQKQQALVLASNLLRLASGVATSAICIGSIMFGDDKNYHNLSLSIHEGCMVSGLSIAFSHCKHAEKLWMHHMATAWHGFKIRSSTDHPSWWDLVLFILICKVSPSRSPVWKQLGQFPWPRIVWACGVLLDLLAYSKASLPLDQVPLIKTIKGRVRRPCWVNKLVLLQRMRAMKHHRHQGMRTHGDLVTKSDAIVMSEKLLATGVYMMKSRTAFEQVTHLTIHWDPASYDCSTLVAIAYSPQKNVACIPPIQNISPLLKREIDLELQQLSSVNKLTRIDGYTEMRALSNSMNWLGLPLGFFALDPAIHCRPLEAHEIRVKEDGRMWVLNQNTGDKTPLLPDGFDLAKTPLLCSISDQGGINRASLDYASFKLKIPILVAYDPYHRCWNDIKESLRKCKTNLFKTLIAFALVWNSNFGPMGSKEWHGRKKQKLANLMDLSNANAEPFLSFLPFICQERGIDEPHDEAGRQKLWESLANLNTTSVLGPLTKLMRWFSWWECEKHYRGENYCNKMLMQDIPDPGKSIGFLKMKLLRLLKKG